MEMHMPSGHMPECKTGLRKLPTEALDCAGHTMVVRLHVTHRDEGQGMWQGESEATH